MAHTVAAEIFTPLLPISFSIWYDNMPLFRLPILVMPGKHLDKAGFIRAVDLRDLLADTAPVKHRINSRPVREASMKLSPMVCCRRTNIRLQNWPCPEGRAPLFGFHMDAKPRQLTLLLLATGKISFVTRWADHLLSLSHKGKSRISSDPPSRK